ncbi:MAG: MFS transporter [Lactobacillaceae bacterium]|jgi:EmrB/QacA subfamily drug resistance transporter|nr:MFS transporter [Lactobacillaceae bacterium]
MTKEIKIALLMASSLFMDVLDGTIVTSALPKMSQAFNTSAATISLLVSVYMISVAVFIPLSGWLALRFGKKNIWLFAVVLFTLSSLASALSVNFSMLLSMRLLQGIAGSMMTPTARLIVLEKTPNDQMLRMISYLVWPALVAPALAPVVGGFLVTYMSWHWIFLINVPIGIVASLIGLHLIPRDTEVEKRKFDVTGFLELGFGSAFVLAGFELISRGQSAANLGITLLLIGVLLILITYVHLKKSSNPLFSISALTIKTFRISQTGGTLFNITVAGLPYVLTILLQTIFGWSAAKTGWYIMFIFIGNIGIKPFTNPIIRKLGFKGALISSLGSLILSAVGLSFINKETPAMIIMFLALISGAGRSLTFTAYNGLQFTEIPPTDRNSANTLTAVTQSMGQGLGISLMTVLIQLFALSLGTIKAYSLGFIILALFSVVPLIEVLALPKNAGQEAIE